LALTAINVAGFVFGLWFYRFQLATVPAYLWPWLLDSPMPVLAFAIICGLLFLHKRLPGWFALWTAVGLAKAGLWTALVLVLHWGHFWALSPAITTLNLPLHIGMIGEALVLAPRIRVGRLALAGVAGWYLLNDALDYWAGTLTAIPPTYVSALAIESVAATVVFTAGLWAAQKYLKGPSK